MKNKVPGKSLPSPSFKAMERAASVNRQLLQQRGSASRSTATPPGMPAPHQARHMPKAVQPKASPVQPPGTKMLPAAPPVYRPQPIPKVLQTKQHHHVQSHPPTRPTTSLPGSRQRNEALPIQRKPMPQAQHPGTQKPRTTIQNQRSAGLIPSLQVIQRAKGSNNADNNNNDTRGLGNIVEGSGGLPINIQQQILSNLNEPDLISVSRVSRPAYASVEHYRSTIDPIGTSTPGEDPGLLNDQSANEYKKEIDEMEKKAEQAYQHMIAFVKANNKWGELDWGKSEDDRKAIALLKDLAPQLKNNCSAVVMRKGKPAAVTFNEPPKNKMSVSREEQKKKKKNKDYEPKGKKNPYYEKMDEVFGEGQYEIIFNDEVAYQHAEIRLWERFAGDPSLVYIGIWQTCCLFCSAQLIAAGFKGFGGTHGNIYGHYVFSAKILADPFRRRRLFGAEVANWYHRASDRQRQVFLFALATLGRGLGSFKKSKVYQGKVTGGSNDINNNNNSGSDDRGDQKKRKGNK